MVFTLHKHVVKNFNEKHSDNDSINKTDISLTDGLKKRDVYIHLLCSFP